MKALRTANEALFGYGSPVSMGLFRILVGTLCFLSVAMLLYDFEPWFTEAGYLPTGAVRGWGEGGFRINVFPPHADPAVSIAILVGVMAAAALTALGLWTRITSIALFVGMVSIHHRVPDILNSGDTLLRQFTLFVALAPSGAACSLDRLIGLWKGTAPDTPAPVSLWPQRLVQFQLSVVYFTTVWHKMHGTTWRDGTATWFPTQLKEFERFWFPSFLDQQPFIALTTYGTLVVELALATLVFAKPIRKWVILSGLALHAGIEYRFNIPLFSFTICSAYVMHYGGEEIVAWAKGFGQRMKRIRLVVFAPAGASLSPTRGRVLGAVDPFDLVEYREGDSGAWHAHGEDGQPSPWKRASLSRSPGAWALWLWPPAWAKLVAAAFVLAESTSPARRSKERSHAP